MSGGQRGGRSGRKCSSAARRRGREGERRPGGPPWVPIAATSLPEPGLSLLRGGEPAPAGPGLPRPPSLHPAPAPCPPAAAARPSGGPRGREERADPPAPDPRGMRPFTCGGAQGGPAGRERWARRGTGPGPGGPRSSTGCRRPPARPPPPGGPFIRRGWEGSRGAPSPSPGPPALPRPHILRHFAGGERVWCRPPALSPPPPAPPAVAPWGVPRQAPHTAVPPAFGRGASPPTRHHRAAVSLCWFPSLLSEFSLSSVRFLPQFCQTFPSVLIFIPLPPPHLPTQLFPSVSGRVGMREELFSKTIIPLHFEEAEGGFTKASGDCGSVGYRSSQAHHSPCASHPLMAVLNTSRLVQPKPWSLSLTGSTAAGPQPPRSWPPHPSRCVFHHKCNGGVFQIPAKPLAGRSSMCQRQCRHWGKWRVHIDPQGSEKQAAVKHVRLAEADMDIYCTITGWC